jgi:hypothetical protein
MLFEKSKEAWLRRGVVAFVVTVVLGASGIAAAGILSAAGSSSDPNDKAEANEQDAGVHGGPIERFHQAGSCDPSSSNFPGG